MTKIISLNIRTLYRDTKRQSEHWYPDKDDAKNEAWTCGYIRLKDKDYCPDCWKGYCIGNKEPFYGIVVTADGKVWDEDTEEVIKPV